jgi:aspartyl-tRNA synthetase
MAISFSLVQTKVGVNDAIGALRPEDRTSVFGKSPLGHKGWKPPGVTYAKHDELNNRWAAVHHPFTALKDGHEDWIHRSGKFTPFTTCSMKE